MIAIEADVNKQKALKCLDQMEPFPPVLTRLLSTLAQDSDAVPLVEIGNLISKDAILSGRVMAIANSALYSRGQDIISIHRAVARLGVDKIRNTALGCSVNRLWGKVRVPADWSVLRFNLHLLATAVASDLLSTRFPTQYAEGAFVAGLFHDMGRLVMAVWLQERYAELWRASEGDPEKLRTLERENLGFDHAELSSDILKVWHLPREIQMAVRYHEVPETDPTKVKQHEAQLSKVLHVADQYVGLLGFSIHDEVADDGPDPLEQLDASDDQEDILQSFRTEFGLIRSFM